MKARNIFVFLSVFCLFFLTSPFLGAESRSPESPSAYFPADQYEFDQILEGDDVSHELIIQNKGNALLEVKDLGTA